MRRCVRACVRRACGKQAVAMAHAPEMRVGVPTQSAVCTTRWFSTHFRASCFRRPAACRCRNSRSPRCAADDVRPPTLARTRPRPLLAGSCDRGRARAAAAGVANCAALGVRAILAPGVECSCVWPPGACTNSDRCRVSCPVRTLWGTRPRWSQGVYRVVPYDGAGDCGLGCVRPCRLVIIFCRAPTHGTGANPEAEPWSA